jgi:hypothetical protein
LNKDVTLNARLIRRLEEAQSVTALLRFLSANFDPKDEIFLT